MRLLAIVALFLVGGGAGAELDGIQAEFERPEYVGSPGGTLLTNGFGGGGQQGWYNPVEGGSDLNVYTYARNNLGIPINPGYRAGEQFIAGMTGPNATYARAQYDITYKEGAGSYVLGYNICATFRGGVPTADYLGGFSLEPSDTARSVSAVAKWVDVDNPTSWNALFNVFDASGNPLNEQSPGAAWMNLELDHWYALGMIFGFRNNMIRRVLIYDLTTGERAYNWHPIWYLAGGANPSEPLPTGFSIFTGGSTASGGNTLAFDRVAYFPIPEPGLVSSLGLGVFAALGLRRRK
jgi:hypothetical protein